MFGGVFSQCDMCSSSSPPLQWCSGRPQKSKPAISSHHSITGSTANPSATSPPISHSIILNCQSSSRSNHFSLSPSVHLSAGKPLKPSWHRAVRVLHFYIISTVCGRTWGQVECCLGGERGERQSGVVWWWFRRGLQSPNLSPNSNSCGLL